MLRLVLLRYRLTLYANSNIDDVYMLFSNYNIYEKYIYNILYTKPDESPRKYVFHYFFVDALYDSITANGLAVQKVSFASSVTVCYWDRCEREH